MKRFLDSRVVRARSWYGPVARWLIGAASAAGEIGRGLDRTRVSAHHRLVVGLAYRRRVIALAWSWVHSRRGHSATSLQIALLSPLRSLLALGTQVSVVGNGEFGHMPMPLTVQEWAWGYVLRHSGHQLSAVASQPGWLHLEALLTRRSEWRLVGQVFLTAAHQAPTPGLSLSALNVSSAMSVPTLTALTAATSVCLA